jgi:hypothetical protein
MKAITRTMSVRRELANYVSIRNDSQDVNAAGCRVGPTNPAIDIAAIIRPATRRKAFMDASGNAARRRVYSPRQNTLE